MSQTQAQVEKDVSFPRHSSLESNHKSRFSLLQTRETVAALNPQTTKAIYERESKLEAAVGAHEEAAQQGETQNHQLLCRIFNFFSPQPNDSRKASAAASTLARTRTARPTAFRTSSEQ